MYVKNRINNEESVKFTFGGKVAYNYLILIIFSTFAIPSNFIINNVLTSIFNFVPLTGVNQYGEITRYTFTSLISMLFSFIFLLSIYLSGNKFKFVKSNVVYYILIICIFFVYLGVSACFNADFGFFHLHFFYLLQIIFLSTLSVNDIILLKSKLMKLLGVAGLINAFAIFVQYGVITNFDYLNLQNWRIVRVSGISYDPILSTILAGFSIIAILENNRDKSKQVSVILKVFIILLSGILTGSRTFFLIIPFVMLSYILFLKVDKRQKIRFLITGFIFLFLIFTIFNSTIINFIDLLLDTGFESNARNFKSELSKSLFRDNPIFGIGTNQYRFYESQYVGIYNGISGTNPHNIYYQILAENGIIGFLMGIVGISGVLFSHFKNKEFFPIGILIIYLLVGTSLGILNSSQFTSIVIFSSGIYIRYRKKSDVSVNKESSDIYE